LAQQTATTHRIVTHDEWIEARKQHLLEEKTFTRERDRLSQARRDLPWEEVEKEYTFEGSKGRQTLSDLFNGSSQLVIYHAMFDPANATEHTSWTEDAACPLCSWWLDNLNGMVVHLRHGEVTPVAVSKAPYPKIEAYSKRMGGGPSIGTPPAIATSTLTMASHSPARRSPVERPRTTTARRLRSRPKIPGLASSSRTTRARCSTPTRPTAGVSTC
jgi:hypothetical protein